jgi:hypothetical protein
MVIAITVSSLIIKKQITITDSSRLYITEGNSNCKGEIYYCFFICITDGNSYSNAIVSVTNSNIDLFFVYSHSILLKVTVIAMIIAITVIFSLLLTASITEDNSKKNNSESSVICFHSNSNGNSYFCLFFSVTDNYRNSNAAFVTNSISDSFFVCGLILYYCSLIEKNESVLLLVIYSILLRVTVIAMLSFLLLTV